MIAVLRSEVYRTLSIPSSWASMAGALIVGALCAWFDENFWTLFAGLGAFGVAVVLTSQHYQHRTAVLLFLGEPRRLRALAAQAVTAMVIATALTAVSGVPVLPAGEGAQYRSTLLVTPLIALFGVANATVLRKPIWLLAGWGAWFVFVEGLIGRLESRLPFTSFLFAATGRDRFLIVFLGWTAAAVLAAVWSIRRDLTGD